MISGLIPHRYAKALYKYAEETNSQAALYECMKGVVKCYESERELQKTLSNPYIGTAEKQKLMIQLAGKDCDESYRRFVKLVLDHKREEMFQLMALAYRDIYRKENRISRVRITTAVKMNAEEMKRLHEVVEKSFPDSKFEYEEQTNADLIGGFVIDVDETRLDASISGELEQLRQNLLTK